MDDEVEGEGRVGEVALTRLRLSSTTRPPGLKTPSLQHDSASTN